MLYGITLWITHRYGAARRLKTDACENISQIRLRIRHLSNIMLNALLGEVNLFLTKKASISSDN